MALQTATNPKTGERVALVGGQWVPITQTATNRETGARVGLVNGQWLPLPISAGMGKPTQAQPEEEGFIGGLAKSVVQGTKQTAGSLYAAGATGLGENQAVVESAQAAQERAKETPKAQQRFEADVAARKQADDESLWAGIKNVASATIDNPEGALQMVISQLPNTAAALASGYTGFKIGAAAGTVLAPFAPGAGTAIGGTVGFLTGLFAANTALELGGKAQEKAADGELTEAERYAAMSEGLKKGATITAVDAATFGASKWLLGSTRRAMETATVRTIENAGLDAAKVTKSIKEAQAQAMAATAKQGKEATTAAVEKATAEAMAKEGLTDPILIASIREAQAKALNGLNTLAKKAARGGTAISLETVGEGLGEYLGEYAATGEASATDAVLESLAGLSMSLGELRAAAKLDKAGVLTGATMDKGEAAPPETPETPEVNPEDVATAAEYIASITGPDDTNAESSEYHAEKLGVALPAKDENYLPNLNAAIAAKVQELQAPATTTPTAPVTTEEKDALIQQRAEEIRTTLRVPYEIALATATKQINEETQDAQTQAGQPAGDGRVPDTTDVGRPADGGGVSVLEQPDTVQPTTIQGTEAEPTGVVPAGADVAGVGGREAGESPALADVVSQTATAVESELTAAASTVELLSTRQKLLGELDQIIAESDRLLQSSDSIDAEERLAVRAKIEANNKAFDEKIKEIDSLPRLNEAAPTADVIDLGGPVDLTANIPDVKPGQLSPGSTATTTIERDGETTTTTIPAKAEPTAEDEARKRQAIGIARANFNSAFVEQKSFKDINESIDAYYQNTVDTLQEQGFGEEAATDAAMREYDRLVADYKKTKGKQKPAVEPTAEEQAAADEVNVEAQMDEAFADPEVQAIMDKPISRRGGARKGAGRKPADLTPEEREAREKQRNISKGDMNADRRALDKAEADMAALTDTSDLEGMPEVDAQRELASRVQKLQGIVTTLHRISKTNGGGTYGKRARKLLKDNNIPQRMVDNAQREFERVQMLANRAKDEGIDTSMAEATPSTPANAKIAKAKNAQQLLTEVAKHNAFFKLIADRIRSAVAGVNVVVIETDSVLPAQLLRNLESWNRPDGSVRALGLMVSDKGNNRTIYLRGESFGADQGVNVVTALHEVLHAALDRKLKIGINAARGDVAIDKGTMDFLTDIYDLMDVAQEKFLDIDDLGKAPPALKKLVATSLRRDANGEMELGIFTDPWEFLAYGLSDPVMQSFLKRVPWPDQRNALTKFVDAIRKVLKLSSTYSPKLMALIFAKDKILSKKMLREELGLRKSSSSNALLGLASTAEKILSARQTKEMQEDYQLLSASAQEAVRTQEQLDKDVNVAIAKVRKSDRRRKVAQGASKLQLLRDPRKNAAALAEMFRGAKVLAKRIIGNVYTNDALAAIAKAAGLPSVEDTTNLIQRMHGMTGQMLEAAQDTMGNVYRAMKNDPALNGKLKEIIHVATLSRVDPAKNKTNAKLNKMWDGLGEVGQREYLRLRDYYKTMLDTYSALLDKQVQDLDLTQEQKAKLLSEIRKKFEAQAKIEPYFPLARFGEHWVGLGKGKKREFYMFETRAEQQALLKSIAEERGVTVKELLADDVSFGMGAKEARSSMLSSSQELKDLFGAIDSTNFAGDADIIKDQLKESIYQLYLASMPQQNLRTQFINRKDITGFETDVLRSFAKTASGSAYQLSRVAYMQRIVNAAKAAKKNAKNNEDLMVYSQELDKRVALELDNSSTRDSILNKVATYANRAAYLHFLSGASSALLQPMQLLTVGFNVLGARHGYANATKELLNTFKIWNELGYHKKNADGTVSWVMPSIRYSKSMAVNTEERNALFDMLGTGVADETLNNEIVDRKTMPTEAYGSTWQKVKNGALIATTGLMHTTERLSREVMLLTSYRLSRKKGMSIEAAKAQAIADTYEGVGNMSSTNRPPIMRNPLGKVSLQFMMFPLYMASFLLKNFKGMIKPMNGQSRAEATKLFVGTMAATWVLAGAAGLPMFSMLTGFIGWMINGLGDDDDEEMKTLKEMGFETWVRKVWLPNMVGHETVMGYPIADIIERGPANVLTGIDFSSRLSLNDMFVRDRKETRTTKEGLIEMGMGATGPFGAQVMSYADAYDAFMQGDYQKGIEKASPALIRNLALVYKYAQEGAKDFRGAELIARSDYTTGMMIAQAIGFRSDKLANMQKLGFELTAVEQKINFERSKIMNITNRVFMQNDQAGIDSALDKVIKFNSQYPAYAITPENLIESLTKRAEQRAVSKAGVIQSEKNLSIPGVAEALNTIKD